MSYNIRKELNIKVVAILLIVLMVIFAGCALKADVKQDQKDTAEPTLITGISTADESESAVLLIRSNRLLTFTSVKQPDPPGVILYFPETALSGIDSNIVPESDLITSIKVSELTNSPHTSRVEVTLQKDTSYEVIREDTGLKVTFKKTAEILSLAQNTEAATQETAVQQPEAAPAEKSDPVATRLRSVYVKKLDKGVEIHVTADGPIKDYNYFTIDNPPRIVFDVPNIQSDFKREHLVSVNTEWVQSIRHFGYPDRLRIVLDTKQPYLSDYTSSTTESGLIIQVGGKEPERELAVAQKRSPVNDFEKPAWVNRIDFSSDDVGKSTIIVGTTKPVEYQLKKAAEKRLLLELLNTRLPVYRQRPLVTTRFESAVDRIIPVQTEAMKNTTQISIEMREGVPYRIEQTEDLLLIYFEASTVPPKPLEEADLPPWKQVFAQTAAETISLKPDMPVSAKPGSMDVYTVEEKAPDSYQEEAVKRYTGEKIALDFFETDVKNVFRILREISGENFAIDKDVKGKVSLTFEKPVPWDQVLDLVLKMNQLGKKYEGNIIRIATLATLKQEEDAKREKFEAEKKALEQQKALEPLFTEYIPVSYANAKTEVQPHIEKILTKDRGSISVDTRTNQVILTDTAEIIKQAKEIIRVIDKVTPQVIIEARIVEANTNFSKEIGTEWGAGYGNQTPWVMRNVTDALTAGTAADLESLVGYNGMPYGFNSAVNLGNLTSASDPSFGISFVRIPGTPLVLNAKILAKESQGELKIISSPKIVTLDNKKAIIKQGLKYPYNKLDNNGNSTTEFIPIELELETTPHVTPDNRISMLIKISKSDLGSIINASQSFTTKEAQTELLVDDGDTVVIGGIMKTTEDVGGTGVPFLSKLPILGWLFKSKKDSTQKEELLIFITPKIVQLEQHAG